MPFKVFFLFLFSLGCCLVRPEKKGPEVDLNFLYEESYSQLLIQPHVDVHFLGLFIGGKNLAK